MKPTGSLTVTVTGAREASASPTWGQRFSWRWYGTVDEEAPFVNATCDEIPVRCDLSRLVEVVEGVFRRHDALRTVFQVQDGVLRQVVQGLGEVVVDVYEANPQQAATVAAGAADHVASRPWRAAHWPMRLATVVADGSPAFLVLAHNPRVLDTRSLNAVKKEILTALADAVSDDAPRWQPVEQARHEQSAEGRAISDQALRHWRSILGSAPPTMFDFPVRVPATRRFVLARLESAALARAVWMMRKRWRLTSGALLVSAWAVVVSQYTGHREVVLQTYAANRGDRHRRQMIGTLLMSGLLHLDLRGLTFEQVARKASSASGAANRSAFCDPEAVRALEEEMRRRHGAYLDLSVYVNDLRSDGDAFDQEPEFTERDLHDLARARAAGADDRAAESSWPDWHHTWDVGPIRRDNRFNLLATHGRNLPLYLFADTMYASRDTVWEMLHGMERLLVAAACGEVSAAELGPTTCVTRVSRGPEWVRRGDGWVDLIATRRHWRHIAGSVEAAVFAEACVDDPDDHRLVGYLTGDGPPSFVELHDAFVNGIGTRNDVRAPDRYRWIAFAPADVDDPAAWRRAEVLAESDGRE